MPKLPQPTSSEPVPAGTYKVQISKYEHGHSKNKGTPQITWTARVAKGDCEGQTIWDRTMMTENSLWRVANLLGACGLTFPVDVDTDSAFFDLICQTAVGRTSFWRVEEKTLETGNVVNEVKGYAKDEDQPTVEVEDETSGPGWITEDKEETKKDK